MYARKGKDGNFKEIRGKVDLWYKGTYRFAESHQMNDTGNS
jgi:hypothetical protein